MSIRGHSGIWKVILRRNRWEVSQTSALGRFLALGVLPALAVGLVLGPQTWQLLTAEVDLPITTGGFISAVLIWLLATLVAWIALWTVGGSTRFKGARTTAAIGVI